MSTEELIAAAEGLVKELQGRINGGGMDLQEAEAKILEMVNWIGDAMVQEVVAGLAEPTSANQITVDGEVAVFERVRNLRFINRFGEEVVQPRRCYRYRNRSGGVAPLDVKLGIDGCFGFSPLMTFLICMLGAAESYAGAAEKLEAMLGFKVSSTAVQRTTEKTGERIPDAPQELIDEQRQQQPCSLMVVEVDGTTSPQITEQEGVTGVASVVMSPSAALATDDAVLTDEDAGNDNHAKANIRAFEGVVILVLPACGPAVDLASCCHCHPVRFSIGFVVAPAHSDQIT